MKADHNKFKYRKYSLDDQIRQVVADIRRLEQKAKMTPIVKQRSAIQETIIFLKDLKVSLDDLKTGKLS